MHDAQITPADKIHIHRLGLFRDILQYLALNILFQHMRLIRFIRSDPIRKKGLYAIHRVNHNIPLSVCLLFGKAQVSRFAPSAF